MPVSARKVLYTASLAAAGVVALFAASPARSAAQPTHVPDPQQVEFFDQKVKPVLEHACFKCHGGESKIKGGLRLTTRAGLLKGGETGPSIDLAAPDKSLLLKAISYKDEDLQMPPKEQLPADQVALLTRWIQMGAPYGASAAPEPHETTAAAPQSHAPPKVTPETMKFWSFQPVRRPAVPVVKDKSWPKTPIDNFILAKLESQNLKHAGPAPKVALLRRAYYDLTGLAPSPKDVETFLADNAPNAFEKVVDRLLASPQYGEKWGRHWLDVVRYAETNSFERDGIKPNAWRYRDYVIDSFNKDKPYDQFVREQIAGDEIANPTAESIIATGFYRLGIWDDEPADKPTARMDELDDIVTTVGQGFMGLTMNCARCHDHKIDPIPAADYYGLLAFFNNITPYSNGSSVMEPIVPADQKKAYEQEQLALEQRKHDLRTRISSFHKKAFDAWTPAEKETWEKLRGGDRDDALDARILAATNPDDFRIFKRLKKDLAELDKDKDSSIPKALAVKETGPTPVDTFIMKRGNANTPGDRVEPHLPQVLNPPSLKLSRERSERSPKPKTTGLRLQLANYLASPQNPLTARVMANRIWQHHFGRGIVKSPNDFGFGGDRPTHPELLDYLASELVANGWHIKALHKQIMLSSAYQMASTAVDESLAKDPQNDLFWRFDMRRLTAEEIRDSILALTGKLNLKMGGPGIYPAIPAAILAGQSRPGEGWGKSTPEEASRRSVYIHAKRSLAVPMVAAFDAADTDFSCPARFTTTQANQSLMMLNSDQINAEAKDLATRLKKEAPANTESQVRLALRLATSREPQNDEITRGVTFIHTLKSKYNLSDEQALNQFALLVLNLNEFVYLD